MMSVVLGGVVVAALLGLYTYTVVFAIFVAIGRYPPDAFAASYANTMTTIGGLVSALAIAVLAVTPPGEAPAPRVLRPIDSARAEQALKVLTAIYLGVWLVLGLAAYVVGTMRHPTVVHELADLGQSWLGVALASGYAYFRVKPAQDHSAGHATEDDPR